MCIYIYGGIIYIYNPLTWNKAFSLTKEDPPQHGAQRRARASVRILTKQHGKIWLICQNLCDISQNVWTWNKAILGWFPYKNHVSSEVAVRWWSNLPRYVYLLMCPSRCHSIDVIFPWIFPVVLPTSELANLSELFHGPFLRFCNSWTIRYHLELPSPGLGNWVATEVSAKQLLAFLPQNQQWATTIGAGWKHVPQQKISYTHIYIYIHTYVCILCINCVYIWFNIHWHIICATATHLPPVAMLAGKPTVPTLGQVGQVDSEPTLQRPGDVSVAKCHDYPLLN